MISHTIKMVEKNKYFLDYYVLQTDAAQGIMNLTDNIVYDRSLVLEAEQRLRRISSYGALCLVRRIVRVLVKLALILPTKIALSRFSFLKMKCGLRHRTSQ